MFISNKIKTLIVHEKIGKFNIIIFFTVFIAIIETAGIGMIIPLVNIILNPDYVDKIRDFVPYLKNFSYLKIYNYFLGTSVVNFFG